MSDVLLAEEAYSPALIIPFEPYREREELHGRPLGAIAKELENMADRLLNLAFDLATAREWGEWSDGSYGSDGQPDISATEIDPEVLFDCPDKRVVGLMGLWKECMNRLWEMEVLGNP